MPLFYNFYHLKLCQSLNVLLNNTINTIYLYCARINIIALRRFLIYVSYWIYNSINLNKISIFLKSLTNLSRLSSTQPACLNSMLTPARNTRQLRSTSSNPLYIPRVKTKAGTRAFSVATPTLWNTHPASVKLERNIVSFRRRLKTYLFKVAYPSLDF